MRNTEPDRKSVTERDKIPAEDSKRYPILRWYTFQLVFLQMVIERFILFSRTVS